MLFYTAKANSRKTREARPVFIWSTIHSCSEIFNCVVNKSLNICNIYYDITFYDKVRFDELYTIYYPNTKRNLNLNIKVIRILVCHIFKKIANKCSNKFFVEISILYVLSICEKLRYRYTQRV